MPPEVVETPPAPAQPVAGATPAQPAKESTTPAPGTDPAKTSKPQDDRSNWIPPHRLKEESGKRTAAEKKAAEYEARLAERDRQIQALTNTTPPSQEEADLDEIRQRIVTLFPVLAKLTDEKLDQVLGVANNATQLQETTDHYWASHGRTMLDSLESKLAEKIGGELTERQKNAITRAYIAEATENPEFLGRHEKGDQKLLDDFVKDWVNDWYEPARRQAQQTTVGRQRAIPRSGPSSPVTTKVNTTPKDLDAATDRAVEYLKEHGLMGS